MYRFILIISTVFLFADVHSQNNEIDSLKNLLNTNLHDSTKLSILNDLVDALPDGEWEKYNAKLKDLAERGLTVSNLDKRTKRIYLGYLSFALHNEGVIYINGSNDFAGLKCYEKSAIIRKEIGDKEALADTEIEIAKIHLRQGNMIKAVDLLYKVLKSYEEIKNHEGMGDVYVNISAIYAQQQNYGKALAAIDNAYKNFEIANYRLGMYKALYRKAYLYSKRNMIKEALEYFEKSNSILDSNQRKQEVVSINDNLATAYILQKKYDEAILRYKENLQIAKKQNKTLLIAQSYVRICKVYYKMGDDANLIATSEIAIDYLENSNDLYATCQLTEFLYEAYKRQGNYKKAMEIYEQHVAIKDTLTSKDVKRNLLEEQLKYEFEKKELLAKNISDKKIADLKLKTEIDKAKTNNLILLLVSIAIVLLVVSVSVFYYLKQKNIITNQKANLFQQKLLLSQMNPHFIFNSINSIQNYVLNKNEDLAYNYLAKFSKLIRMVLNNSRENILSLQVEIETLNLYIALEQLRFDNSFVYELKIAEGLDLFAVEIPTMLIQPYVENAIWHGLMNLKNERKGVLKIDISTDANLIKVVIEDNGVGRVRSNEFKKKSIHQSVAMKLTEERLGMINKMENTENVKVIVSDLHDEEQNACGTRVELFLPLMN